MYKIDDIGETKKFVDLMEATKKVNLDWIKLRQSKEYRIGMVLNKTSKDLKRVKLLSIYKNIKKWKMGLKKEIKYKDKTKQSNSINISNYFSNEKIAIYTCIFGNYDNILEPYFVPDNCDFYIFTDQEVPKNSIWKKIDIPVEIQNMSNVDKNRYIKMLPHKLFKDYKHSIYVDGNIQIISDLTEFINLINPKIGISIHKHHLRNCVYEEIIAISKMNKKYKEDAKKYRKKLLENKMPVKYGLLQCNIIARNHNNKKCNEIMEDWWNEFKNSVKRDQLSLPYVLFKKGIDVDEVGTLGNNVYTNSAIRVILHK